MAARDYLSHAIRGCRTSSGNAYTIQNLLRRVGYSTYTGENIGVNNWPDTGATYKYGCTSSGHQVQGQHADAGAGGGRPADVDAERRPPREHPELRATTGSGARPGRARATGSSSPASSRRAAPRRWTRRTRRVGGLADNSASVRKGSTITFQASFGDGFRLSDGWVKIDGVEQRGWSWNVDVTSATQTLAVDPTKLATGWHTIVWAVRDVAGHVTRRSASFEVRR